MLKFTIICFLAHLIYYVQVESAAVVSFNSGEVKGQINITEVEDGLKFDGQINGVPAGKHGLHIHTTGNIYPDCHAALGLLNREIYGAHNDHNNPSDLGNIEPNADGVANVQIERKGLSLTTGQNKILGHAIVMHQKAGHGGVRIACGVVGVL